MLLFASGHEEHGSELRNGGKRSGYTGPFANDIHVLFVAEM